MTFSVGRSGSFHRGRTVYAMQAFKVSLGLVHRVCKLLACIKYVGNQYVSFKWLGVRDTDWFKLDI